MTEIPADKILMGQNLYGYDWTLPFVQGTTAKAVSPSEPFRLAAENNVAIQYDDQRPKRHFSTIRTATATSTKYGLRIRGRFRRKFDLVKEIEN